VVGSAEPGKGGRLVGFERYIGIDYSGAETPDSSLKGLRAYMADRSSPPSEVGPPPSPRKYWTRRGVAEWLEARLSEDPPSLVGIDHGFSLPLQYFEKSRLPLNWPAFIEDFCLHWPTAEENMRKRLKHRIHFWPFDGWKIPRGKSVLAEVYPALWSKAFPRDERTRDQHDAYSIAAWMREVDADGSLAGYFDPRLEDAECKLAEIEGWILGVTA
jgi:hypothetical protein